MSPKTAIAIDIGATNTRVALIDELGQLVYKNKKKTSHTESNNEFINFLKEFIEESLKEKEIADSFGIGICIAGFINIEQGTLVSSPNLPNKNLEIVVNFKDYFQKKVTLNNDANAAILGEKTWGHGKNLENFIYLTFSSGIGGSIITNGKLVTDKCGNSIEPGHVKIGSEYDLLCGCGEKNHWEAYASGLNLPNFLTAWVGKSNVKLDFDGSDVYQIFDAIKKNDKIANQFFEQVMKINLIGINDLIKKYQPELIIIGGSVYLFNQELFYQFLPKKPEFKAAFFGDNESLVGAVSPIFYSK
ncbi:MAG: ROK family protein [Patescibacteria group bacterium]|jgi:glucokinase|nr:ROK family protein [Patescibacteria group bacterium]